MASTVRANEPLNSGQLRISGVLLILGLLVEALPLVWSHPIAFSLLLFIGGGLVLSGIIVFLHTVITHFVKTRSG